MILSDKKSKNKDLLGLNSCASILGWKGRTPFENARATSATMGSVSYGAIWNWMISLRFAKKDDWNKSPTVFPPIHSPFKWLWSYHAQIQVVDNLHYIRLVKLPIKGYSWLGLLSRKSDSQKQSAPQNQAKSIRGSSFFSKATWSYTSLFLNKYNSWLFTHYIKQLSVRIRHIIFNQLLWYLKNILKKSFKWTNHLYYIGLH